MKIVIAASHRFHLLDLARELEQCGHDVSFYSYLPSNRTVSFGLSKKASRSLYVVALPFLGLVKLTKGSFWSLKLLHQFLDYYVAFATPFCDVFIGLGTVYKFAFKHIKHKYNATNILEWGSKHIEEQQRILNTIPGVKQQPVYFTKRSLDGYALADYIAIASDHVKQSFIEHGVLERKLLQNSYGVDLSMFSPTQLDPNEQYDVIMVGGWSYRKGCDLLIDFFKNSELKFLHVGALVDLPFPTLSNMTHIKSVNQNLLHVYYSKARIFVLPSREEGLAMVQLQALVCGLPIVCSKDTGGRDLKKFLTDDKWIIEMENFSLFSLEDAINKGLKLAKEQVLTQKRDYGSTIAEALTWKSYGARYNQTLLRIKNNITIR